MQQLKDYRKQLRITCLTVKNDKPHTHIFEVRLENQQPHAIFKYQVEKTKDEVVKFYQVLESQLFGFTHPYQRTFAESISTSTDVAKKINDEMKEMLERLDLLTNHCFVSFFGIQVNYEDFVTSLKEDYSIPSFQIKKIQNQSKPLANQIKFNTERPWIKKQPTKNNEVNKIVKVEEKQVKSYFKTLTQVAERRDIYQLDIGVNKVKDILFIPNQEGGLIYVLEANKQTKITGFFKSFLGKQQQYGSISIHRCQQNKYRKVWSEKILTEPISMKFIDKYSMLYLLTPLGVYLYSAPLGKKQQQLQLFTFVELVNCIACSTSSIRGQVYLLRKDPGQLRIYSINKQITVKSNANLKQPSSLCVEDHNSRLYVSDQQGVHVLSLQQFGEVKHLHLVKADYVFKSMEVIQVYLLCLCEQGLVIVLELHKPHKEQLTSIISSFRVPQETKTLTFLQENPRIICAGFRQCLSIIHTFQGPLFSIQQGKGQIVKTVSANKQNIMTITSEGLLGVFSINSRFV